MYLQIIDGEIPLELLDDRILSSCKQPPDSRKLWVKKVAMKLFSTGPTNTDLSAAIAQHTNTIYKYNFRHITTQTQFNVIFCRPNTIKFQTPLVMRRLLSPFLDFSLLRCFNLPKLWNLKKFKAFSQSANQILSALLNCTANVAENMLKLIVFKLKVFLSYKSLYRHFHIFNKEPCEVTNLSQKNFH